MEDQHSVHSVKNCFRNPVLESQSPQVPSCQPSDKLCCAGRETTKPEYGRCFKSRITQEELDMLICSFIQCKILVQKNDLTVGLKETKGPALSHNI